MDDEPTLNIEMGGSAVNEARDVEYYPYLAGSVGRDADAIWPTEHADPLTWD